jgi:hypothetical protein
VDRARVVVEHGTPELIQACKDGKISVTKAVKIAGLQKDKQTAAMDKKQPDARPQKTVPQKPTGPRRTISEKAKYIREWVSSGEKLANACATCGLSKGEYQRAVLVAESGHEELIEAMDTGLLTVNAARKSLDTKDQISEIVEEARFKDAKKNHKQMSSRGKSKPQLLLELLGATYTDWKGAENNLPINSATIPSDPNKLLEVVRLCKVVRKTVVFMLDKIEREVERCSVKTADKKTC